LFATWVPAATAQQREAQQHQSSMTALDLFSLWGHQACCTDKQQTIRPAAITAGTTLQNVYAVLYVQQDAANNFGILLQHIAVN
jgi:hypothetical protein